MLVSTLNMFAEIHQCIHVMALHFDFCPVINIAALTLILLFLPCMLLPSVLKCSYHIICFWEVVNRYIFMLHAGFLYLPVLYRNIVFFPFCVVLMKSFVFSNFPSFSLARIT